MLVLREAAGSMADAGIRGGNEVQPSTRMDAHMKTNVLRAVAVALPLALATLAGAAPASAAADHGITGTAYQNGDLYISANARYKEGTGNITVAFTSLPKNGLYIGVMNASNATFGTPKTFSRNETGIRRTIASNVANGKRFYNFFRLASSCSGSCKPYNFVGSERY